MINGIPVFRILLIEMLIVGSLAPMIKILLRFSVDIIPISMSIAIFIVDYGLFTGELLRVTDMGRQGYLLNTLPPADIIKAVDDFLKDRR